MTKKQKTDVYQKVTDTIISMLEKGTVPWRKTWKTSGGNGFGYFAQPKNLKSGKPYRGINVWMLHAIGCEMGYQSEYWMTFKQAKELAGQQAEAEGRNIEERERKRGKGTYLWDADNDCMFEGGVRKGESGTMVVFWKKLLIDDKDKETGKVKLNKDGKKKKRMSFFLKHYVVFNSEQCDGIDSKVPAPPVLETPKSEEERVASAIKEAEELIANMPEMPEVRHGGNKACYTPALDLINMPKQESFETDEHYYCTLFHEYTHSTGHESRIGRAGIEEFNGFGTEQYSKEELVAEMGASFLGAMTGIGDVTIDNSASYIQGWLKKLKDDKKMIVHASAQAQKAVDYMTNNVQDYSDNK